MSDLLFTIVERLFSEETPETKDSVLDLYHRLVHLSEIIDENYEPTKQSASRFLDRAGDFVASGATSVDQRLLLRLLAEICYVDSDLFSGLLSVAHQDRVLPWLVVQGGLSHASASLPTQLDGLVEETLILSLTDSFPVAQYVHENHVASSRWRPDIRSLRAFATPQTATARISQEGYKFLVVLEDFVGSGIQSGGPLNFLAQVAAGLPTIIVPLVICHQGLSRWKKNLAGSANIAVSPVMVLERDHLLADDPNGRVDPQAEEFRRILSEFDARVNSDKDPEYPGYLGFGSIGALYARYTNCPNNSVSALHNSSSNWTPPFPRIKR